MILDASPFIYIIDAHWFYRQDFKDPFTALLYCSVFLHCKNIKIIDFLKEIHSNKKSQDIICKRLTASELKVVNAIIYDGDMPKKIAKKLHCSEKTINSHKMNALRKLGVKNSRMLCSLFYSWKISWPILNDRKCNRTGSPGQRATGSPGANENEATAVSHHGAGRPVQQAE
ncbi:hypothetical protein IAV70_004397 [Salmonella enterica]|nr:hypothetical protein [Salmonella enterica]